jgi:hypothetical protein
LAADDGWRACELHRSKEQKELGLGISNGAAPCLEDPYYSEMTVLKSCSVDYGHPWGCAERRFIKTDELKQQIKIGTNRK